MFPLAKLSLLILSCEVVLTVGFHATSICTRRGIIGEKNIQHRPFAINGKHNHYSKWGHGERSIAKRSRSTASTTSINNTCLQDYDIEILSEDPKCFLVHNFLSPKECQKYISKAKTVASNNPDLMTQSNAPQVSLQVERLWPLPILGLGAGIPPIIRLLQESDGSTVDDILSAALPPIGIAFGVIATLIFAITNLVQNYAETSSRTSESLALNLKKDCDFIHTLVDTAGDVTQHPWSQWEAPVITKYEKDAVFASHNDASPTRGSEWAALGGQRVVTIITYLNTCHEGGGTKFDQLGFTVQPKQGSALVFYPADENLDADGRTIHQSLPAVDEKYIVQLFGRHKRVPSPLGIPESYGPMGDQSSIDSSVVDESSEEKDEGPLSWLKILLEY